MIQQVNFSTFENGRIFMCEYESRACSTDTGRRNGYLWNPQVAMGRSTELERRLFHYDAAGSATASTGQDRLTGASIVHGGQLTLSGAMMVRMGCRRFYIKGSAEISSI